MNTLIEYSSHDQQDKLEEILNFFVSIIIKLPTVVKNENRCRDLQTSFVLSLHYVITKSIKVISNETAGKIYYCILDTFKLRQGVYDEAILTISSLSLNIGEQFSNMMASFNEFLVFALKRFNEPSLLRISIIATGDIAKSIKDKFELYSNSIIGILIEILQVNNF